MRRRERGDLTELLGYARRRLGLALRPKLRITAPPDNVSFDRDVEVRVRDRTILRGNVFRPTASGVFPVIMCAHPYGKDGLPKPGRDGKGYRIPFLFRLLPQSTSFTFSAWTTWEGPDPGFWVPRGYVVVNCDLRGWGRSDGVGELFSEQEGRDDFDLIEWAARQPWSNGRVGLLGVSYLAISQRAGAAERPPHLAAICPWEGFTDAYRDFIRRGGILENGFARIWQLGLKRQRRSPVHLLRDAKHHPLFDDWWATRDRDIEGIDVPALVCGSFSDHNLKQPRELRGLPPDQLDPQVAVHASWRQVGDLLFRRSAAVAGEVLRPLLARR